MRKDKKTDGKRSFGRDKTDSREKKGPVIRSAAKGFGKKSFKSGPDRDVRPKDDFHRISKKSEFSLDEENDSDDRINLIEGRNPVLEALKSGREIDKLFIQKGAVEGSIRQIIAMAREKNILIKEVDKAKLDALSVSKHHQGVIASAALYRYYEIDEILQIAKDKGEDPFIVILDEISDPHNLGSILRTCDAAGVHGVIIPKRRAVGLTPVVAKTSAGAIEYVPVAKVTNITQTIEYLKKKNIWIAGADIAGAPYYKKDMTGPIAVVIGSEGEGISRLVKESCDYLVSIPMSGKITSLNAGVSAAIIVYDVKKQRGSKQSAESIH